MPVRVHIRFPHDTCPPLKRFFLFCLPVLRRPLAGCFDVDGYVVQETAGRYFLMCNHLSMLHMTVNEWLGTNKREASESMLHAARSGFHVWTAMSRLNSLFVTEKPLHFTHWTCYTHNLLITYPFRPVTSWLVCNLVIQVVCAVDAIIICGSCKCCIIFGRFVKVERYHCSS